MYSDLTPPICNRERGRESQRVGQSLLMLKAIEASRVKIPRPKHTHTPVTSEEY